MPLNLIFSTAGNFTIDDDGIPGNGISSIFKDGVFVQNFAHPADELVIRVSEGLAGVHITLNFVDSLGAADLIVGPTIGGLASPPDSIVVRSVNTAGAVTLFSNGTITELGSDAGADIFAA
jgi:hypothetical protein